MKKLIALMLGLVLVLSLTLQAFAAQDPDEMRKLVVTGSASVALKADMATIELGAQTRGRSVEDAQKENANTTEAILKALTELGIPKEDIRTSSYYVTFEQDYSVTGAIERLANGSFLVSNMLQITLKDVSLVSKVIDTAAKAGANSINGLNFQSSQSTEAYHKALQRAVEDAKIKAEVLAAAAGQQLGVIIKLEANESYGTPYGISNTFNFDAKSAMETPILSGDINVSATVVITFEMK